MTHGKCNLSTFKKRSKECAKGPYHIQVSYWWTHCVIRVNVYLCVDTFWAFPMSWVLRTLQLCSSCQISSRRFCKINEHRWKQNNIQCKHWCAEKILILGGKRKENIADRYVCFQAAVLSMHFIFVFCVWTLPLLQQPSPLLVTSF